MGFFSSHNSLLVFTHVFVLLARQGQTCGYAKLCVCLRPEFMHPKDFQGAGSLDTLGASSETFTQRDRRGELSTTGRASRACSGFAKKTTPKVWKHPIFLHNQPISRGHCATFLPALLPHAHTHFVLPLDMSKSIHAVTLPSSPHHIKEQKDTCSSTSAPRILFTTTRLPSQKKSH